jgi:hypothetical protein
MAAVLETCARLGIRPPVLCDEQGRIIARQGNVYRVGTSAFRASAITWASTARKK